MKITMNFAGNLSYSADQVTGMTLGELQQAVEQAIQDHGADTEVVMFQTNNHYGANYGTLSPYDTFTPVEEEEEGEDF